MSPSSCHRSIELPVSEVFPTPVSLATTIFLPDQPDARLPILFLFPGAGYARGYFDLNPDGSSGYSQAAFHTSRGMIVVTMDHLGTGESSLPSDDQLLFPPPASRTDRFELPKTLNLEVLAQANADGVSEVLGQLRAGTLVQGLRPMDPTCVIGVGQSMGGHIVVASQAEHGPFDAIAALGTSFTQTRLLLRSGTRPLIRNAPPEAIIGSAVNADMRSTFHWPDEPVALVDADMSPTTNTRWKSPTIPRCALQLQLPGMLAREAAAIRVPVFLGYGEIDVTPEPLADLAAFRSSCDLRLSIIPQMAHMHNFAKSREALWKRLDSFAQSVAACIIS